MASVGESSSSATNDKPLVVRVKRKASQSPLEALLLEINERPAKRALLDFAKLSISDSSGKEELKNKKILVQHVETVTISETTVEIVKSIVSSSSENVENKAKGEERRHTFKKDNKQDQLLFKSRQRQEVLAKSARFEQIWKSRRGDKETLHDNDVHEKYHFYDIVRVDAEEGSSIEVQKEDIPIEDQRLLSSYLPFLREQLPAAAAEIESEIHDYISQQDEYVYDYYAVRDDMDIRIEDGCPFPLVQVEEEDLYDGPDESSEDESYDSNAENHPYNDYPDEMSDEEDDLQNSDSDHESAENDNSSEESLETDRSLRNGLSEGHGDYADNLDFEDSDYADYGDLDYDSDDGDYDELR